MEARRGRGEWWGLRAVLPSAWRYLATLEPADGPTNMAVDAALLASVRAGAAGVLRLYRWDPPTLSFGRNQPAAGLYDEEAAADRGIAFVRRPTGGQAVLHADELTYAVAAPVAAIGRPRAAYRRINEALVTGLRRLGVAARLAPELAGAPVGAGGARGSGIGGGGRAHRGRPDWSAACFRHPAEGEVVVGGRKLVGSAQRCEDRVILQHGSILISGSQATAESLLREAPETRPGASAMPGWTTLDAELGGRPDASSVMAALRLGFEERLGTALAPGELSVEESTRVRELRATFASPEWTWRR